MILKCKGTDCPLKERCYSYYAEYPDAELKDVPYKGGMCEKFITKEQYYGRN
tara:strand:+ start:67 stop:222 length:156 start_codon:yes stop_codon:yes gene_type:complete